MAGNHYSRIINGEYTTELLDYRIRITKSSRTTETNEYYIGITNTDHMTELREKFSRMCEAVSTRGMHLIHDEFRPTKSLESIMSAYVAPSLAASRQDLVLVEGPNRGREATVRTIKEWGHSTGKITDLFYVTTSGISLHEPDYSQVTKILGLRSSVKMHHQRSLSSGSVLRHAKHFAENNRGARVLVVSFEITSLVNSHGPSHETRALREDSQRKNRDYSARRFREVQGENDRLRADNLTLFKRLSEVERGETVTRSHDSSKSGSHSHRRSSASTQGPKRELFLYLSY